MMSCNRMKSKCDGKIAGLYDLEDTVGRGHYAVVKVARHVFTGEKVAVKVIDKSRLDDISRAHLFQEVRCMKLVQHPNVVRLYEVIDTQTKLYLILELGDGGDLYDYIMKHDTGLTEQEACFYFSQIVSAIAYCHQLHVVHRDLKPENVVFFNKLETVKLTDFGFSNLFIPGHKLNTSCGSLAYSAPEILLGDSYDAPAVDVWSLGVILYMLVCGKPPFQEANDSETLIRIMDCHYITPDHLSASCVDLLRGMLKRDPLQRITLTQICVHSWFSSSPRVTTPLAAQNLPILHDLGKKSAGKNLRFMPKMPLICLGPLTEDDHSHIVQKMVDGKIAKRDEIMQSLERNAYNHVSATYYLLAERLLRKCSSLKGSVESKQPASTAAAPTLSRQVMVNGVSSSEDNVPVVNSSALSELSNSSASIKPNSHSRSKRCSLIKEELCEEEEEEFSENGFGIDEVKQSQSANALSSDTDASCVHGKSLPTSPSTAGTTNTRLLQTVHSMPQLMLNQISEEDEDEDMSCSFSAYPQHQQPMFSIADAGNFGGCARKANRKSSTKKTASVQSGMASAPNTSRKLGHKQGKDLPDLAVKATLADGGRVPVEADERPWTASVGQRMISCSSTDDEDDSSFLVRHFCLQHEPVRQHSLVQSASDVEGFGEGHTDPLSTGTTNSLDRRLFQHVRKDGKSGASRSIVGAVKKSVSMLLGHLSAVGDMASAKPRCIETWSSCSDLMQASAKLRCANASVNLADRHRVAGCQFARELRHNRSEREAQFSDLNKLQSSSSHVIRVRSRDFDTLVSKFTAGDQTTATTTKTDTC